MTETLSNGKSQNYNLNANEDFVIFLTSKLITCFISCFISKMKSPSIVYLLSESQHKYWILDLEDEVHSVWVIWTSGLQECKGRKQYRSRAERATVFGRVLKFSHLFYEDCLGCRIMGLGPYPPPLKGHRGRVRATSHMSQEPWPWNCESPKESVQRLSQDTSKIM